MSHTDGDTLTMFSDQQWRTIRFGFWTVTVVVLFAFVVLPLARQWSNREHQLSIQRERVARLTQVVSGQATVDAASAKLESALALQPSRVPRARSRALAASALQSLVQEMADASNVTVTRLDVAGIDNGGSDLPVTFSANGDVYGIAALLQKVRHGSHVIVLDKLTLQVNSALRGAPDVLQMTLSLHAPVIVE